MSKPTKYLLFFLVFLFISVTVYIALYDTTAPSHDIEVIIPADQLDYKKNL